MNHKISWIITMLCIISIASGVQVNYETTSVSRIVGENANDMARQLKINDFTLDSAGLYIPDYYTQKILEKQYGSEATTKYPAFLASDVKDKLDNGKNNQVLIQSISSGNTPYWTANAKESDAANWNLNKNNLFIFDSKHAGLHIPKSDTFASRISSKNPYIAPLSYKSMAFVQAAICNLGRYSSIAEDFRQARNKYYIYTKQKSEFLGLTLLSYALYGKPTLKVSVPNVDISAFCGDYLKEVETQSADTYSITGTSGTYTKTVEVNLGEPNTATYENHTLIESSRTVQQFIPDEPVLPVAAEITRFPLKTVILNTTLTSIGDAVDITADVPMWNENEFASRICYANSSSANMEFSQSYTENEVLAIANINPVEVVDCSKGEFKFYKTIKYTIEYLPYSPVLITDVKYPAQMLPGQQTEVEVIVENTESNPANGTFVLSSDSEIKSVLQASITKSSYKLELTAPTEEGRYQYRVDFYDGAESKTYATFAIEVKALEAELQIPEVVSSTAQLQLLITNNLNSDITTTIEDFLSKDGAVLKSNSQSVKLIPGANTVTITYTNLEKSKISYDVLVNIPYLGKNKVLTGTIITNHNPIINQNNVELYEGDTFTLTPATTDLDGDTVTTTINSPFATDGSYAFTYEESGEYPITIKATDGILTTEKTTILTVLNTNRQPVLTVSDTAEGSENSELMITATAADFDNENSVNNDDNTLTITYGAPLDANGKWTPTFDDSGEINVPVTASDGELSDTKLVTIKIANTNRAPHLDDLTDVTVKEGELVDLLLGRDPDNENVVDNDDNILQHSFNGPFDHYGKWQTDYDSSGVYEIIPSVTDGYLVAGKKITVTVENVNRAPQITAADTIYVKGSADLSVYVIDPDNFNSVTNDDNTLTITYTSPFDSTGRWTPTQTGTAYTTITVSDGEYSVQKNLYVTVEAVNVPPEQTPPLPPEQPPVPTEQPPTPPPPTPQPTEQPPASQPTPQPATQPTTQSPPTTPQQDLIIEVKADGKKMNNEDTIKVKPDDEINVEIDIRNNANEAKEVDIEAEIGDLDQEESDTLTIEANFDEEIEYEFEIPRLTDDDEYLLNIFVDEQEWNVNIKVDKPSHEVGIRYLKIEPEIAKCENNIAVLTVKLENTGKDEEEGVLRIESALGNGEVKFDLPQGETKMFTKTFNNLIAGEHDINVKAAYGKRIIEKSLKLTVESCKAEKIMQTKVEQREIIVEPAKLVEATTIETETMPVSDIMNIALLTAASIFAILLIITFVPPLLK
ncbi:MAG TPA: hypothetical protein VI612_03355 [Candidatus Nanoarchaeia archaeon]|nr:hypothetical protein [Candidatus Nanoarchaeia archaeon]